VEPWTGADEYAACEVVRTVVTVRCAGVGVISVVAVGADWCRANICRTNTNPDADADLGAGIASRNHANRK
jgi:hypothetical protein